MTQVVELSPELRIESRDRQRSRIASGLLATARPKQWSKNVLVFAAPGAAGVLIRSSALAQAFLTFALFCVIAAGTYFVNDAIDVRVDRIHPVKRLRPMAAGVFSARTGLIVGGLLLASGFAGSAATNWKLGAVVAAYVAIQFAYSYRLKHMAVYDLAAVAAGFVLRCIAGGVATNVSVSEWFLIVATFGSLLMVTGKRIAEHSELGAERGSHRRSLTAYTETFLNIVLGVSAAGAILGYCLWAFSLQTALEHHRDPIWYQLSIVPMLLALLRYTYVVEGKNGGRPEELVLSDRSLQLLGLIWVVLFTAGVYAR